MSRWMDIIAGPFCLAYIIIKLKIQLYCEKKITLGILEFILQKTNKYKTYVPITQTRVESVGQYKTNNKINQDIFLNMNTYW